MLGKMPLPCRFDCSARGCLCASLDARANACCHRQAKPQREALPELDGERQAHVRNRANRRNQGPDGRVSPAKCSAEARCHQRHPRRCACRASTVDLILFAQRLPSPIDANPTIGDAEFPLPPPFRTWLEKVLSEAMTRTGVHAIPQERPLCASMSDRTLHSQPEAVIRLPLSTSPRTRAGSGSGSLRGSGNGRGRPPSLGGDYRTSSCNNIRARRASTFSP